MKPVLLWILKYLVIPAGFIYATGIPQTLYEWKSSPVKDPFNTFTQAEFATLEIPLQNTQAYLDTLVYVRTYLAKTGDYSQFLYFRDLKQIRMFQALYQDSADNNLAYRPVSGDLDRLVMSLCELCFKRWRDGVEPYPSDRETAAAREYWFPNSKKDEAHSTTTSFTDVVSWLLGWQMRLYLRGLPIALVLFLLWKFRDKEKTIAMAPVSFLISVSIWPVVLGIDIYNRTRDFLSRVDVISRRDNLLGLFSKQEQQLLHVGKGLSLQKFQAYLDSLGMTKKHSWILSACVTVLITALPHLVVAQSVSKTIKHVHKTEVTVDHDVGISHAMSAQWNAMVTEMLELTDPELLFLFFYRVTSIGKISSGYPADIGGVPKVSFGFARN